jgi:hypothetical protein
MKRSNKFLKNISDYTMVGGLGALLMFNMVGCSDRNSTQNDSTFSDAAQKKGAFVVIEKDANGNYKIVNEFPNETTTIILRENGSERILSQKEIDELVAAEAKKIDEGRSNLTNTHSSGGLSLGETILASAAGAMVGAYIGNKLFNNSNYTQNRRMNYKSPQTYSRSVNSFNKNTPPPRKNRESSSTSSGYFGGGGGSKKSSGSRGSFFGG